MDVIYFHLKELGLKKEYVVEIDPVNYKTEYKANAPLFCVYFGDAGGDFKDLDILSALTTDASLILPVVDDLDRFKASTPPSLHKINGFKLSTKAEIEPLVSIILEGLGLLRLSRRLFISYKRDESSTVAMQLYEQLEKNGFDVFLDTHSIRPGELFQDELWHRLADTDVVVLINTPRFLDSDWTKEELARANGMQIGILQVLWPGHKLAVTASISIPLQLKDSDFGNSKFSDSKSYLLDEPVQRIVEQAEYIRARTLAARQDNIVTEFMAAARRTGKAADLQPQKFIRTTKKNGDDILVIPTVGVPHAFTYNRSQDTVERLLLAKKPDIYLLYDHINIRDRWLKHLDWLDNYLPIKAVKVVDAEKWLQNV